MIIAARKTFGVFSSPMLVALLWQRAAVESLLASCRPAAITGFIVAVVVDSIERKFSVWARSHVPEERGEVALPFFAHRYSTTAIIFKSRILRVEASRFCMLPRYVFRGGSSCFILTMLQRFSFANCGIPTSAARAVSSGERLSGDFALSSADTLTQPESFTLATNKAAWCRGDNPPSKKFSTFKINGAHSFMYYSKAFSAMYIYIVSLISGVGPTISFR